MAIINFKTLLSAFNEKGTLLKWLQKLETALAKSVLTDVTATTSAGAAVFSFNFADGTKIETPPVTLPQGEPGTPGTDGRGIASIEAGASYVAGGETITPLTITFTEGQPVSLSVKAKNGTDGTDGTDGRGITSIFTTGHRTEGNEEITTLEIAYDSGDPSEQIEVHAQNGSTITDIHVPYSYESGNLTISKVVVETSDRGGVNDDDPLTFDVAAKNGRGVTAFGSGDPTTDPAHPGYTATPITAVYTDGSAPASFKVYAANGADAAGALFYHLIKVVGETEQSDVIGFLSILNQSSSPIESEDDLVLALSAMGVVNDVVYPFNGGATNNAGEHFIGISTNINGYAVSLITSTGNRVELSVGDVYDYVP